MNRKKIKKIRKKAKGILVEWLQSLVEGPEKEKINEVVLSSSKAKKFIENKKIFKTIFVKDKIINYIIK